MRQYIKAGMRIMAPPQCKQVHRCPPLAIATDQQSILTQPQHGLGFRAWKVNKRPLSSRHTALIWLI